MIEIFKRSESKHNVIYAGYIGDGDFKTFHAISEVDPYRGKSTIEKKECVGHVPKRMMTRLKNLKKALGERVLSYSES